MFIGVTSLAPYWFGGHGTPKLTWWQYLLAPLAMGAVGFALEAIGTFCGSGFTFGHTASHTRVVAGKFAIVALLIVLVIGWPMYELSHL